MAAHGHLASKEVALTLRTPPMLVLAGHRICRLSTTLAISDTAACKALDTSSRMTLSILPRLPHLPVYPAFEDPAPT